MPTELWREIWKDASRRSGYCCAICNHPPRGHPLVVHQVWHFDNLAKIAKFQFFEALCINCHDVKHYGWAE